MDETIKTVEYYRRLPYTRRVRFVDDEGGYLVAHIEELGGVEADGASPIEALANLSDAFDDYLDAMLEWGESVPTGVVEVEPVD